MMWERMRQERQVTVVGVGRSMQKRPGDVAELHVFARGDKSERERRVRVAREAATETSVRIVKGPAHVALARYTEFLEELTADRVEYRNERWSIASCPFGKRPSTSRRSCLSTLMVSYDSKR